MAGTSKSCVSKSEVAERRMIVGTAAGRPVIFAVPGLDRKVVDARDAEPHQAVLVELPVLVAVASKPASAVVVPFIGEPHRDAVVVEGPDLLDQPVIQFAIPFADEKGLDGLATFKKFGAVAPAAVDGIGERHPGRIAAVPG